MTGHRPVFADGRGDDRRTLIGGIGAAVLSHALPRQAIARQAQRPLLLARPGAEVVAGPGERDSPLFRDPNGIPVALA